jgi:hypothetical protein
LTNAGVTFHKRKKHERENYGWHNQGVNRKLDVEGAGITANIHQSRTELPVSSLNTKI